MRRKRLVVASEAVTSETIAFMTRHAGGLICIAMESDRLDALDIPLMVAQNTELLKTAYYCVGRLPTGDNNWYFRV